MYPGTFGTFGGYGLTNKIGGGQIDPHLFLLDRPDCHFAICHSKVSRLAFKYAFTATNMRDYTRLARSF